MPPSPHRFSELIEVLCELAQNFVPDIKRTQICRRWITPGIAATFENDDAGYEALCMDADLFADDLLLSQPSSSGATAFDRMARGYKGTVQENRALIALREARFVLFRIDESGDDGILTCTDLSGGTEFRLALDVDLDLDDGLVLFGRLAEDNAGLFHPAGLLTPMDEVALATASGPSRPAGFSREKESRWVEAIYRHVLIHGTLAVPGFNVPLDGEDEAHAFDGEDTEPEHNDTEEEE